MDLSAWLELSSARLVTGVLLFARFGGLFLAAPIIGTRTVPPLVRLCLSAAVALVLTPVAPVAAIASAAGLLVGVLKEVVLGLALGWVAALLFTSVQIAGEWVDLHAGFQIAQVLDPASNTQNGLLGSFKYLLAGLILLGTGAHDLMIRAAAASLTVSPPGVLRLGPGTPDDWTALLGRAFWVALQLAAPAAAALFLAEIAIGLMNRAVPQLHLLLLSLPVKSLLGIGMVAVSVPILIGIVASIVARLGPELTRAVRIMGG